MSESAEIAELRSRLELRERQIDAIRRVTEALFSYTSVDDMIRETLTVAIDTLQADAGSLSLHNPTDDTLEFRYVVGPAAQRLTGFVMPTSQGIAGRVFRTGHSDLTQSVQEQADFNPAVDARTGYLTQSMMTVPVKRHEGPALGVMQVLNSRHQFDEHDLEVLEVLCSQAGEAIENARLAQQARRAEIVNIIGDISHDIKNMLTPIQTGVWTLEPMLSEMFDALDHLRAACPQGEPWGDRLAHTMSEVREDYGWILAAALDSAEKVQTRTRDIADAIKGELAPPRFELASLNDTAGEVASALRLVAEAAEVRLVLDLDADLPRLQFDRKQLYNALYNLVNNAIPETPAGGQVTVRTRGPRPGDSTVTLQVEDTGRGIPAEVREKLFTAQAISTKPGGTGLGTRIVAGVVERHGGCIVVESEPNQGTRFTVALPLSQEHDTPPPTWS